MNDNTRVKYTSAAIPPIGVRIDTIYTIKHIKDNYDLDDKTLKAMFTPIDGNWDSLYRKNIKKSDKMKDVDNNKTDNGAED